MSGPNDLYKYKALLIPWSVRGLETLTLAGTAWRDGDTFNALISKGMHGYEIIHVRCAGYDSPEMSGSTKPAAIIAADYARSLVDTEEIVYLDSLEFMASDEEDSFGRVLARVTLSDGQDLASLMINSGNAVPDG